MMTNKRMKELYDNMVFHISELVNKNDLVDTLHCIGFTDEEIAEINNGIEGDTTKEIQVQTNIGTLIAIEGGDEDYPAIQVFLETKEGRTLLNITEVNQVEENENILETYIYEDFNDDHAEPERFIYKNTQI